MAQKQEKMIWYRCARCLCILPYSEYKRHKVVDCHSLLDKQHNPTTNFVCRNKLHARIEEWPEEFKDVSTNITGYHVVIMAREIINQIFDCDDNDMYPGQFVLLHTPAKEEPLSLITWPNTVDEDSTSIYMTKKGLEHYGLKSGDVIFASMPQLYSVSAKMVELQFAKEEDEKMLQDQTDELQGYFMEQYYNRGIYVGMDVYIRFYGWMVHTKVQNVIPNVLNKRDGTTNLARARPESSDPLPPFMDKASLCKPYDKQCFLVKKKMTKSTFQKVEESEIVPWTFEQIGGLEEQKDILSEFLDTVLHSTQERGRPTGILLYGPPKNGKTVLASAAICNAKVPCVPVTSAILSKYVGETESSLKEIFEKAKTRAPSIIFFDAINWLFPKNKFSYSDTTHGRIELLCSLMNGLKNKNVAVIATTTDSSDIPEDLRKPSYFGMELKIPAPDRSTRLDVLKLYLGNAVPVEDLDQVAANCRGYSSQELKSLVEHAKEQTSKRNDSGDAKQLSLVDLHKAFAHIQPALLDDDLFKKPVMQWSDLKGIDKIREKLTLGVDIILNRGSAFRKRNIKPPSGMFIYGPPGCGKSAAVEALANETGLYLLYVSVDKVVRPMVGESERRIRHIFEVAKQAAPCIAHFDGIEALGAKRTEAGSVFNRTLSMLLTTTEGVTALKDVIVIASTSKPHEVDKALYRSGRMDWNIYMSLPDANSRTQLIEFLIKTCQLSVDVSVEKLAEATEGLSYAEIRTVFSKAVNSAMKTSVLQWNQVASALEDAARPTQAEIDIYNSFNPCR